MTHPFDAQGRVIVVQAQLWGAERDTVVPLALDTGATRTLLSRDVLTFLGYDPDGTAEHVELTTGSGVVSTPLIPLRRISVLGRQREEILVLAHTLPASASVDGLLGLDFLRDYRLLIDFPAGLITLS